MTNVLCFRDDSRRNVCIQQESSSYKSGIAGRDQQLSNVKGRCNIPSKKGEDIVDIPHMFLQRDSSKNE